MDTLLAQRRKALGEKESELKHRLQCVRNAIAALLGDHHAIESFAATNCSRRPRVVQISKTSRCK